MNGEARMDGLGYRFGQTVRHNKKGLGQFIRSTVTTATVQFPGHERASVVPLETIEPVTEPHSAGRD